jgi:hypothetical protein
VRTAQEINDSLSPCAFNVYSQWGEDGVLAEIFNRIGAENKWCLECGAAEGLFFSNTRTLIEAGWTGVLVEADSSRYERLVKNCEGLSAHCLNANVGRENRLDDLLASKGAPPEIDLVSIDVDGQDFYAFNAMLRFKPRVVVIEYGQGDPDLLPTLGGEGQAGLHTITGLAIGKGYVPVWRSQTNLVFVRQGLEERL